MPRSGRIKKKLPQPDPIYKNRLVTRLINRIMSKGKKSLAQKIVYQTFERIKEKGNTDPVEVFKTAIKNISPQVEVRPRRIGGASYQVPMEVRGSRKEALAVRWLILAARARSNKEYHTMVDKLAAEIADAAKNQGTAVKKREDTHRMAEANKAFAHFRW